MVTESLADQLCSLKTLIESLEGIKTLEDKLHVLDVQESVSMFLNKSPLLKKWIDNLDIKKQWVLKSVIALGQGPIIFNGLLSLQDSEEPLNELVEVLLKVEQFYEGMQGILGYQRTVLSLLSEKEDHLDVLTKTRYLHPPVEDISINSPKLRSIIRIGIEQMPQMAEIFPIGGAGDRLHLIDPATGVHLPSASLVFGGHTLLDGLIRDVQGREYLYYKLSGQQLNLPIALMTSDEKNNHHYIINMCHERQWFDRPQNLFKLFVQPLVPVLTIDGEWVMEAPLQFSLKPGGHGSIWKLALDQGVFAWLKHLHCTKALIRQINNPIAGCDYGLLAFTGLGILGDKIFGFASCPRLLKTAEGMNVLREVQTKEGYEYSVTNIEYTEFQKYGLQDIPEKSGGLYSAFPANTNLLFVDLNKIEPFIKKNPLPGLLLNMKNSFTYLNAENQLQTKLAGRLESTMQNIADVIVDRMSRPLDPNKIEKLKTFITYNKRMKTISVCKKTYVSDKPFIETNEHCFYEMLQNYQNLLVEACKMQLPSIKSFEESLATGPSCVISFHPALGPLYEVIAQKIRGGSLECGSELLLEVSEVELDHIDLNGSLVIKSDALMGSKNEQGYLQYNENSGKCILKNVKIVNRGIDWEKVNSLSRYDFKRKESLSISLQGNAEFSAEGVIFSGSHEIVVPNGYRMTAVMKEGRVVFQKEAISSPTWYWKYAFDTENRIRLHKIER